MNIVKGTEQRLPPRIVIYGTEGVGKTTFGAQFFTPILVPTEDGLGALNVDHFPVAKSTAEVMGALQSLLGSTYETVVLDTADWFERLIFDEICKSYGKVEIEKVDGGYGKGFSYALPYWRRLLDVFDALRARGMWIVILAHAKIEKFEDPEAGAFDRYSPRLNKHGCNILTEWADVVGLATRRLAVVKDGSKGKAVPVGPEGGDRILRCVGSPAFVAKNRYGLPEEMPLKISDFLTAVTNTKG